MIHFTDYLIRYNNNKKKRKQKTRQTTKGKRNELKIMAWGEYNVAKYKVVSDSFDDFFFSSILLLVELWQSSLTRKLFYWLVLSVFSRHTYANPVYARLFPSNSFPFFTSNETLTAIRRWVSPCVRVYNKCELSSHGFCRGRVWVRIKDVDGGNTE